LYLTLLKRTYNKKPMANNGDYLDEERRETERLEEAAARARAREAKAAQLKLKGKYIEQAWKELWAGTSSAMRKESIQRAIKTSKPVLNALQAAHLKSVLQNASPGVDWVSEVQRVGLEYDEQLADIQRRFGITSVASMTEDMERLWDTNEDELRQIAETGEIPEGATLQGFVSEMYYGGAIGLDNLINIFGDEQLYEMLPALKPKIKAEAVYQYVLTGIDDRKLRIKEAYWEVAEYSEFDMIIRLVLIGVLPGDVKARLLEIYAADSSAFAFPSACVNYLGRSYKPEKEVCFDIAIIQDFLTGLPVVKSDWAPLPDKFMEDAQDAIMELSSSTKWLQNSEWITPKLKETPEAIDAILVTGKTYPGRRDIAKLGGFFKKPLGGWVVPIARKAEIEALARQRGYKTQLIQVDKATMEPPSFAEKVEQRVQKDLTKADRLRAQADKLDREATALDQELKPYDDMAFWTEPIHEGERGRRQESLRNKLRDKMDRASEARREARELRDKADRLEGYVARKAEDMVYLNNRLEEARANLRGVDRDLEGASSRSGYKPAEGEWRERLLKAKADYEEQVAYWENRVREIGGIQYGPENVKPGDVVKIRGRWALVLSAGPKKVKVSTQGFELRYSYAEIQGVQHPPEPAEEKAEAAPKAVTAEEAKKRAVTPETPPKEVWEYTRAEYIEKRMAEDREYQNALKMGDKSNLKLVEDLVRKRAGDEHEGAVMVAVAQNKAVPFNVLNDYPGLKKKEPWEMSHEQFVHLYETDYSDNPYVFAERLGDKLGIKSQAGQPLREAFIAGEGQKTVGEKGTLPRDRWRRAVVRRALITGKVVPDETLADFPDLKPFKIPPEHKLESFTGFRSEAYGEGYRNLSAVVTHEVRELGNQDILAYTGVSSEDLPEFVDMLLNMGYTEAIWLCRFLEDVFEHYCDPGDCVIGQYTISDEPIILSDLGDEGLLLAYKKGALVQDKEQVRVKPPEKQAEVGLPYWWAEPIKEPPKPLPSWWLVSEGAVLNILSMYAQIREAILNCENVAEQYPGFEQYFPDLAYSHRLLDLDELGLKTAADVAKLEALIKESPTMARAINGMARLEINYTEGVGKNKGKKYLRVKIRGPVRYGGKLYCGVEVPVTEIKDKTQELVLKFGPKELPEAAYREALAEFGIDIDELDKARKERWAQFPDGLGRGRKVTDFDLEQLKQGIKTEREHTHDPVMALEIAIDHLTEYPDYYTRLAKMEAEAEREAEGAEAAEEPPSLGDLLKANRKGIEAWIEAARGSYEKGEQTLESLKVQLLPLLDKAFKKYYAAKEVTGEDLDRIAQQLLDMATKPVPPPAVPKEPEVTGTKYCEGCKHFHRTPSGMYCMLPHFEGQYTKACPRREVIPPPPVVKPPAEPPVAKLKTLAETYPQTDTVLVHGVLKHRWRCPYCYRNASEGFCMVHGDVDPLDITQQPEDVAERVIDLSLAQYFASKQPKISLEQIHADTGIDTDYLAELLARNHPDVGIPYQDYYRKQFGIVIELPVGEEEVKKEGDIEQLIIDYIRVHKSLYHPDEVAKTIDKILLLLNELPFDSQQLYRFDLDKLKASAASVLGGKVEDVESIRADIGTFYQQDNYPMAGLVDYLVTHRGERFTNEVKLAIASLESGGYPPEKLKVMRSWYH
jgi:hypothetical protein